MSDRGNHRQTSAPRRRWWFARPRLVAGLGVGVLALLCLAYFAYGLNDARSSLVRAESSATQLQADIAKGDVKAARATLSDLQSATADARSRSDGVVWKVGGALPFYGQNLDAVRTIARVLDTIAQDGLPPVVDTEVDAETFRPQDGRIDLAAMEELAPGLAQADQVLSAGLRDLDGIDAESLVGSLQGPFEQLYSKLQSAQKAAFAGSKALTLMPSMMGGDGKRTYALVIQNNAEIRATGGIPGAFAIVKAKNGKLTMGQQGAAIDFGFFSPPVVKLTKSERHLYSNLMGGFWADTNFTPDFPRTAEFMRAMLERKFDRSVDGVISVDPIALSYLLKGTGPVKMPGGDELNSKNAVEKLLSDVYWENDKKPLDQDAYFADAARRVFNAVASGQGNPRAVISGLAKAVDENRILINSTRTDEQDVLQSTRVGGALTRTATSSPHVGLYLNDSTTTKLEYYLTRQTLMNSIRCSVDGTQTLSTTTVLGSNVPAKVKSLPKSILGPGTGEKKGSIRMNLRYYAPIGGTVTDIRINEEPRTIVRGRDGDLEVAVVPVLLAPGQKLTVSATIESGQGQRGDAIFSTTPGVEPTPNNVKVASSCQ